MKNFTKFMFMLVAMAFISNTAMANDDVYAWFYTEFHTYPTGAGKIYVDDSNSLKNEDITDWTEECEKKSFGFCQINSHDYYVYTQGNDGRTCVGLAEGVRADEYSDWELPYDEAGNVVFHNQANQTYPWRYYYASQEKDKDETTAQGMEPLFPTHCCFAVFSCVGARFAKGHKSFAKDVTCFPAVNDLGDNITLTATPADERCHFAYWKNEATGQTYTDNPLNTVVTEPTSYVAYFECDSAIVLSNPGETKTYVWYHPDYCNTYETEGSSYEAWALTEPNFNDSIDVNDPSKRLTYVEAVAIDRCYPAAPTIITVKNEAIIVPSPNLNGFSQLHDPFLFWSGEQGLSGDQMNETGMYYLVDTDNMRLYLTTEKSIAPNTAYAAIYADQLAAEGLEAPQYIYFSEEAAKAGEGTGITVVENRENDGQIYNLGGMRMTNAGKGIYILNGKKYINK